MSSLSLPSRLFAVVLDLGLASLAAGQTGVLTLETGERVPQLRAQRPATYGSTGTSYLSVGAMQFSPWTSSVTYSDTGIGTLSDSRYATAGIGPPGPAVFVAAVNLPNGSLITSMAFDLCDSSTSGFHITAGLRACDILGNNCSFIAGVGITVSNPSAPCAQYIFDVSFANYTVSNLTGRVFIYAATSAFDATNSISGALIGYRLQVSPDPGFATFDDVPVTNAQHRFIEALFAAGITSGCSANPPLFCPDAPLTRGQAAVFLSLALGLQFP